MELLRPRLTPVLSGWDVGIVLEALSKNLYDLLREPFLKRIKDKTPQDKTPPSQNPISYFQLRTKPHSSMFPGMIILMINIIYNYIIKYTFIYIKFKLYFDKKN